MFTRPEQVETFKQIMKEAGNLLLSFWSKPIVSVKKGKSIVTEADLAVEKFLIDRLSVLVPDASFLAEESGHSGDLKSDYQWVIDPLDGTRNFARRIPYFCVSVALTHHNEPVMAAIYNPVVDELFFAIKGQPSTCNGSPIRVSDGISFADSIIVARPFFKPKNSMAPSRDRVQVIAGQVAGVRHMGAVALDLANLAAGRFDGIIFSGVNWWDIAAGALIVTQAGGKIADLNGAFISSKQQSCVAGGSPVFDHLYQKLKD